ncbi:MAG: hypothetical protein AVDCRST_MAG93-3364 [uncultured Chloroflexia bacterium]|uniref:Uncharacterized protein n=1 Tax=uncultured Chloroflexia bacterium TaxID=1672391 RepID=A0A6J4JNU4_9CHLR|nr:MAG: hypothetical protein AVDCRST_MAG93-3364 [uncultured Chloroflexia bacterium]
MIALSVVFVGAVLLGRGGSPQPVAAQPPSPDAEVIELRAQRDEMRRSEDRLLQVMVGALTVLVLVNVAGYVVVHRSYDRDRDAIGTVVMAGARDLIAQESSAAAKERTAIERELGQRFDQSIAAAVEPINNILRELMSAQTEHGKQILGTYERDLNAIDRHQGLRGVLTSRVDLLQVELWSLSARREIDRGYPVQAVGYYVLIAKLDIERDRPFSIPGLLNSIIEGLEAIKPGEPMHDLAPFEVQGLRELTDAYVPRDELDRRGVNRIRSILEKIDATSGTTG